MLLCIVMSDNTTTSSHRLIILTGLAGAGRTSALRIFEDLGYDTVDNLPIFLLPRLVSATTPLNRPLAIGMDTRPHHFNIPAFANHLQTLRQYQPVSLVFLDCDTDVLRRRYNETRRPHPLRQEGQVRHAIARERQLAEPLRDLADVVIDTSAFQPADLRRVLSGHFSLEDSPQLAITVASFSYKYGIPRDADLVFDARIFANPHYVDALRPLTGLDAPVADYIQSQPLFSPFFEAVCNLITLTLQQCDRDGRSYLTIAVGCTGGRHRSVFIADQLTKWLQKQDQRVYSIHHDLEKRGVS